MFHRVSDLGLEGVCGVLGDSVEIVLAYKFLNLVFVMVGRKDDYGVALIGSGYCGIVFL